MRATAIREHRGLARRVRRVIYEMGVLWGVLTIGKFARIFHTRGGVMRECAEGFVTYEAEYS